MSQAMVFAATDSLSRLIYILQVFLQEISVNKISFSVVFFVFFDLFSKQQLAFVFGLEKVQSASESG